MFVSCRCLIFLTYQTDPQSIILSEQSHTEVELMFFTFVAFHISEVQSNLWFIYCLFMVYLPVLSVPHTGEKHGIITVMHMCVPQYFQTEGRNCLF
jgi:hypothetical protein